MYLHLGQDTVIRTDTVLGVFDLDNASVEKATREFLRRAQKEGRVQNVSMELPKAFVVCRSPGGMKVYLTQMGPATLARRARAGQPWAE